MTDDQVTYNSAPYTDARVGADVRAQEKNGSDVTPT